MPKHKQPVAKYEYRNARGCVAFEKRRYLPKRFSYHWPDGSAAHGSEVQKLLYRLPELIHADPRVTVYIAEGEKDVDRLRSLGLIATCNFDGGGKGKWSKTYGRYFRGRDVVVVPDNDRTGREHAQEVAGNLAGVAGSVRVLGLPDLPPKGDVCDWLDGGGTINELQALANAVLEWKQGIELERKCDTFALDMELRVAIERVLSTDLSAQEKLLLIVLQSKIIRPKPTQQTIAAAVSLSPGRVKKMIAKLRKQGFVRTTKRGRENVYC